MANECGIASTTIKNFCKVRTFKCLGTNSRNDRHEIRVVKRIVKSCIRKLQIFIRVLLLPFTDILVFKSECLAGIVDCYDKIERRARECYIGAQKTLENDCVVTATIQNRIVAIASGENISVIAACTTHKIIARATIKREA